MPIDVQALGFKLTPRIKHDGQTFACVMFPRAARNPHLPCTTRTCACVKVLQTRIRRANGHQS